MNPEDRPAADTFRRIMDDELIAAQREMNAAISRQITFRNQYPLPPLTRRQRIRRKLRTWQEDHRERLALRICPWLSSD